MKRVFIVGGKRTPVGSFMGTLKQFTGVDLAALAVIDTVKKFKLNHHAIEELVLGNAISTGIGQNPARQVAVLSRMNNKAPCYQVSNGTSSGLRAIGLVYGDILLSQIDFGFAGGFESLSNVPQIIRGSRPGVKYGDTVCEDLIGVDMLIDPEFKVAGGFIAESVAKQNKVTKEIQDEYAKLSFERAFAAMNSKKFDFEMSSVKISNSQPPLVDEWYQNFHPRQVEVSQPIYVKSKTQGGITSMNSSKLADGACVIGLASESYCSSHNVTPLAEIVASVTVGGSHINIIDTVNRAASECLKRAELPKETIGYWEIHEDFSSNMLLIMKSLGVHFSKVNVHGGSIAIGNPFGMTGARLVISLVNILRERRETYGCVLIPSEDGSASAMIIKSRN